MKTSTSTGSHAGGVIGLVLTACVLAPGSASASLGQDVASVEVDRARMRGEVHIVEAPDHTVHEIRVPGGTLIREFVSLEGTVFGIAWQGPFRPDLRQLLGGYFDEFQAITQAARRPSGRGPITIDTPKLVVHMGGHARAFFGHAYAPGLLPPAFAARDIQ
jgi:hypothetical protein